MTVLGQRSDIGEFRKKFRWQALFVVTVFVVILSRLFTLQVVQGDEYMAAARENIIRRVVLATTRGVVRDSQGRVLASSRPSYNVYVVPGRNIERRFVCVTRTEIWPKLVEYIRLTTEDRTRLEKKLDEICEEPSK